MKNILKNFPRNNKGFMSFIILAIVLSVLVTVGWSVKNYLDNKTKIEKQEADAKILAIQQAIASGKEVTTGGVSVGGEEKIKCPSGIATLRVDLDARNSLNPAGIWVNAPYAIVRASDGKSVVASGTLTQGSSKTITTATISCSDDVINNGVLAVGTGSTSFSGGYEEENGKPKVLKFGDGTSVESSFESRNTTTLTMQWLTTAFANDTAGPNGATVTTNAITLGTGDPFSRILRILSITSGNQLGHKKILVSIDTVNTTVWADSDISVSVSSGNLALKEVSCSLYTNIASARSANRCYESSVYNSGTGEVDLKVGGTPSRGNPTGSGADPIVYIDDIVPALDAKTGLLIEEGFDSALNNLGAGTVSGTVDAS